MAMTLYILGLMLKQYYKYYTLQFTIYLQNGFEIFQAYHISIRARDIGGRVRATNNTNCLT